MEQRSLRAQCIDIYLSKYAYCIGEPVTFCFELNNTNTYRTSTVIVKYDGDSYFMRAETRVYFFSESNKVTLFPKVGATVNDIPQLLHFRITSPFGLSEVSKFINLSLDMFTGDFYKDNTTVKNILLFGVAGSTKSSFVNSCFTLLSPKICMEMAISGGHQKRVTTEIRSYRLANLNTRKGASYRLWDCWGLEDSNYKDNTFLCMLKGKLPSGWKMTEAKSPIGDPNPNHAPHCVIFFIPASQLADTPDSTMLRIIEMFQLALQTGVSPMIVLTKIDTICPQFKYDSSKYETLDAAMLFRVSPERVIPLINYLYESEKCFEVDRVLLKVLLKATQIAEENFARLQEEECIREARLMKLRHEVEQKFAIELNGALKAIAMLQEVIKAERRSHTLELTALKHQLTLLKFLLGGIALLAFFYFFKK